MKLLVWRTLRLPVLMPVLMLVLLPVLAAPESESESESRSAADKPTQTVMRLQDAVTRQWQRAGQVAVGERYGALLPVVQQSFAFERIAATAIGPGWSGLTADDQAEFHCLLAALSAAEYAARFEDYAGQRFIIQSAKGQPSGQGRTDEHRWMQSLLLPAEGAAGSRRQFDYLLVRVADDIAAPITWKIADVRVDGISDLALRRVQYARIVAAQGMSGLKADIRARIARFLEDQALAPCGGADGIPDPAEPADG